MPSWYAIYCRSQFERTVEAGLEESGFAVFYPSYFETRRWSNRQMEVERPLFPGYVFAQFFPGALQESAVRQAHGVVSILGTPANGPTPIPDDAIEAVRALLASGLPIMNVPPNFKPGESVVIRYGPFAGRTGIIDRLKNKVRIVVTIEALGSSKAIEMDQAMIMPGLTTAA